MHFLRNFMNAQLKVLPLVLVFSGSLFLLVGTTPLKAQEPLKLDQAVEIAQKNAPGVHLAEAQREAAQAGIEIPRTAYLPRLDLLWQINRATVNNVTGLLLPQSVVPPISGPPLEPSATSVWGSAGGLLLSWEPFDFGLRKTQVDVARAQANQFAARVSVSRLENGVLAADTFLSALAAEQNVRAAQAAVSRSVAFTNVVQTLADNGLKPGVDASRARAELAAAQIQLAQTLQAAEVARATLAETLGKAGSSLVLDPGPLLELPKITHLPQPIWEQHPATQAQDALLDVVRSRQKALDLSFVPRFYVQVAVSGRGTGVQNNGRFVQGTNGLLPNTGNWAAGLTVTFPIFDFFGLRARKKVESNLESVEQARREQLIQTLKGQYARAQALIDGAERVAQQTPVQLKAAQEAELAARVRYENGLSNLTEIIDAQRMLTQAESNHALARLAVWRALLAAAQLNGDLTVFLQLVK